MEEEQIRGALEAHWQASAIGDADAEHDIYAGDAICDYPQSGERILGRKNLQALRSHHPGKPSGFNVRRIVGEGELWVTEYTITYLGKPAFTVAANAVLEQVLRSRPRSIEELLQIRGIGPAFCEKHGESLLAALQSTSLASVAAPT